MVHSAWELIRLHRVLSLLLLLLKESVWKLSRVVLSLHEEIRSTITLKLHSLRVRGMCSVRLRRLSIRVRRRFLSRVFWVASSWRSCRWLVMRRLLSFLPSQTVAPNVAWWDILLEVFFLELLCAAQEIRKCILFSGGRYISILSSLLRWASNMSCWMDTVFVIRFSWDCVRTCPHRLSLFRNWSCVLTLVWAFLRLTVSLVIVKHLSIPLRIVSLSCVWSKLLLRIVT